MIRSRRNGGRSDYRHSVRTHPLWNPFETPSEQDIDAARAQLGAWVSTPVEVVAPDPAWPQWYAAARDRVADALGERVLAIEHVGSTSVPGLAAKPIVDIVVAVPDITAEEDYLAPLLAAGYALRVREPGHRLVRTPERDIHVHLYGRGDAAIDEYLLLRDHLRRDAADRALYESTKRSLMERSWADMNAYSDAKTEVIEAVKARARAAGVDPAPAGAAIVTGDANEPVPGAVPARKPGPSFGAALPVLPPRPRFWAATTMSPNPSPLKSPAASADPKRSKGSDAPGTPVLSCDQN